MTGECLVPAEDFNCYGRLDHLYQPVDTNMYVAIFGEGGGAQAIIYRFLFEVIQCAPVNFSPPTMGVSGHQTRGQ